MARRRKASDAPKAQEKRPAPQPPKPAPSAAARQRRVNVRDIKEI